MAASKKYDEQQEEYKKSYFSKIDIDEVLNNDELKKNIVEKVKKFDIENRYDVVKMNDFLEVGVITMDDIVTGMENGSQRFGGAQTVIDVMPKNMLNRLNEASYIKDDGTKIDYQIFLDDKIKTEKEKDIGPDLEFFKLGRIARLLKAKNGVVSPDITNKINKEVKNILDGGYSEATALLRMSSNGRDLRIIFENDVVNDKQTKELIKKMIVELKNTNEELLNDVVVVSKEAVRLGYVSDEEVNEWLG